MDEVVRRGRPQDVAALARLADRVFRPDFEPGTGMALQFPLLYDRENASHLYWIANQFGQPVSLIGTYSSLVHLNGVALPVLSIGSVATLPEYRGEGFATQLLERVLEQGKAAHALLLISGDRGLYLRHGCVHFGDLLRVAWNPSEKNSFFGQTKILAGENLKSALSQLHQLYQVEPYRYARDPEQMAALVLATAEFKYRNRPPTTNVWACYDGAELLAYAVSVPTHDHAALELLEWAGIRSAILSLAATAAKIQGYDTVIWDVLPEDVEFRQLLKAQGIPSAPTGNHGTVALLNAQQLVDSLNPLVQERTGRRLALEEADGQFRLDWVRGSEVVPMPKTFDGPALIQWFFSREGLRMPMVSTAGLNYV